MVLVVLKNILCHRTWTPKRPTEKHDLPVLGVAIPETIAAATNAAPGHDHDRRAHPDVDTNPKVSASTTASEKPCNEDLNVYSTVSSPTTLVPQPSTLSENRKKSVVSTESSLDLADSNRDRNISHDLEAQSGQNQSVARSKKLRFNERIISDATLGLSDGMTVPFALTAGLSSFGNARLVYLGGLAELFAGAVSMGLGGYIAAKGEAHAYIVQLRSTRTLIADSPKDALALVHEVFEPFGLAAPVVDDIAAALSRDPDMLLDFLMKFHVEARKPDSTRPAFSALTIGGSYLLGGLIPLIPYFCVKQHKVLLALYWSIGIMIGALFAFGWTKTAITGGWKGKANMKANARAAFEMVLIGAIAAGIAVGLIRGINHGNQI